MTLKQRMIVISFLESAATILVERGIYFYTEKFYHFDKIHNLLLALLFGLCYAGSAVLTNRVSSRVGERAALLLVLFLHLPMLAVLLIPSPITIVIGTAFSAVLYGFKWPIIESLMVSGDTPGTALKSVGKFNISWAAAIPVALLIAGRLIDLNHWALFAAAALITLASTALAVALPARATHLSDDHPERPDAELLASQGQLLTAARWLMFCSYSLMWILAAVLPIIYSRLNVPVSQASPLSSVIDLMRGTIFVVCNFWTGWHGRKAPLILVMAGLPLGFTLAMFGANLATILAGEAIFGLSTGMCYFASLYYAMVIKNASVEAGGAHEGIIGMGFAVGPMLAAAGFWAGTAWNSETLGITSGVLPLILICSLNATRHLLKKNTGVVGFNK